MFILISNSTFKPSYTTYDVLYYDYIYKIILISSENVLFSQLLHFETHVTFIFYIYYFSLQHRTFLRSNSKVNKSKKLYIELMYTKQTLREITPILKLLL